MEELNQLRVSIALRMAEDAARADDQALVRRQLRDLRIFLTDGGAIHPSQVKPVSYFPHKSWHLQCNDCGATACKLWREYQTCDPGVLCADCVEKRTDRKLDPARLTAIEWWVAAVADEDGNGYWGYTSVPEAGIRWWLGLPTRPVGK